MPEVPDHVDLAELKDEQSALASKVQLVDQVADPLTTVAGFDASYDRHGRGYGSLVLLDRSGEELIEHHEASLDIELPYIPGLLAYREKPLLEALWSELSETPDVLIVDGGGLIHPRRLGSACHFGVLLDVPAIGVAKGLLLGSIEGELEGYGDTAPIREDGELLGYAYRSSRRAKHPIYVSPGHKVTAQRALDLVVSLCTGDHKLPEPTRIADRLAGKLKRSS